DEPLQCRGLETGPGISTSPVPTTIGAAPSRPINSRRRQASVFGVFRSAPHRSSATMPFLYPSLGVVGRLASCCVMDSLLHQENVGYYWMRDDHGSAQCRRLLSHIADWIQM